MPKKPNGDLTVRAERTDNGLIIDLYDTGAPFDPRQAGSPDNLDRPLLERDAGGLGIYLALWGVDEFHYERDGATNRSTFIVRHRPTDA